MFILFNILLRRFVKKRKVGQSSRLSHFVVLSDTKTYFIMSETYVLALCNLPRVSGAC